MNPNRAAFAAHCPAVLARLDALAATDCTPLREDGVLVNLDLGNGALFYEYEAPALAAHQVAAYLEAPDRIFLGDVRYCNLSDRTRPVYEALRAALAVPDQALPALPVADSGYLFCFGIGLGHHLPLLLERLAVRHFCLVEAIPEFLLHSLDAIDWAGLFERAARRGITISFAFIADAEAGASELEQIVAREGNAFLEGSYFYLHYPLPVMVEAMRRLRGLLQLHEMSGGFFEDERLMVANTQANLKSRFRLIEDDCPAPLPLPAFIVGSGPSVTQDLPAIAKWRDRALLFSCGSALRVLLANGIRPDFHCEMENGPHLPGIVGSTAAEFGLDSITLIASTTVDPRLPALFAESWFYFRESVSSTPLFAADRAPLSQAEPTVANVALATAAAMGIQTVYLFGIDCGVREGGAHHAADSIYFQERFRHLDPGLARYDRVVEGNFGGLFRTDRIFDQSRQLMSQAQQNHRLALFNCSDGVRISGAVPKVAASLDLKGVVARGEAVRRDLSARLPAFAAGEFLESIDLAEAREACGRLSHGFAAAIARAADTAEEFWEAERALRHYRDEELRSPFLARVVLTPLFNLLRAAAFLGTRLADPVQRRAFLRLSLPPIGACGRAMGAEIARVLDDC